MVQGFINYDWMGLAAVDHHNLISLNPSNCFWEIKYWKIWKTDGKHTMLSPARWHKEFWITKIPTSLTAGVIINKCQTLASKGPECFAFWQRIKNHTLLCTALGHNVTVASDCQTLNLNRTGQLNDPPCRNQVTHPANAFFWSANYMWERPLRC